MLREHGELRRTLEALEAELAEAGDTDAAAPICEQLLSQLELHNSKEEPIFYTRADASLGPEATAELKAFIDSAQMPAGWTCRQA
jgi:hemerythrin-like domain-containing protein